jgi:hypothetical protein
MLEEYIDARQVRATTAERYRGALRRVMPDWLEKPIAEITPRAALLRH